MSDNNNRTPDDTPESDTKHRAFDEEGPRIDERRDENPGWRRDARPWGPAPSDDRGGRDGYERGPRQDFGRPEYGRPDYDRGPRQDYDRGPRQNYAPREGYDRGPRQDYGRPEYGRPDYDRGPRQDYAPRPEYDRGPRQDYGRPNYDRGPRQDYDRGPRQDYAPRQDYDRGPRQDFAPRGGYDRGPRQDYDRGPRQDYAPRQDYDRGPRQDFGPRGGYDRGPRQDFGPRGGYDRGPRQDFGPRGGYDRGPRQDFGPRREFRDGGYASGGRPRGMEPRHAQIRPRTTARAVAALAVDRVLVDGAFSNIALRNELGNFDMDRRDRAFATRLVYGTLTWYGLIDLTLNELLPKGVGSLTRDIASHLRVAMFQLIVDRENTPVHAAIDECVELVGRDEPKLRGLANGVLRTFERERDEILARVQEQFPTESKLSLPPSLAELLVRRVGEERAQEVMDAWNGPTRTVIRARQKDREDLGESLHYLGLTVEPHPIVPDALLIEGDIRIALSNAEKVSVQDAGAQLAALTLPPELEGIVLDACAGLGGKTVHLLDQLPNVDVVAADIDPRKLQRIPTPGDDSERLARIGGDLTTPEGRARIQDWLVKNEEEAGFDAIVIDAPCSALGTLGRHPEVRWRRSEEEVINLASLQAEILKNVSELVRPGGWLVYVVCTFTEEETFTQLDRFLESSPEFELVAPDDKTADPRVDWSQIVDERGTISMWPSPHVSDGFFIARFRRKES